MTDTTTRLNRILVEHLGLDPLRVVPEALLVPSHDNMGRVLASGLADLGCDSLDIVEIVMAVEEEFHIEITDDESDGLNSGTVQDLYDLVDRKVSTPAA